MIATVLDVCCGPRGFWFNKTDPRALYVDRRAEQHAVDIGTPGTIGRSPIVISPDVLADFQSLPFDNEAFPLVVFDPPHVVRREAKGAITKKYGHLKGDWQGMLRHGFAECFRVLRPEGTLVFKWSAVQLPVREVLALTDQKPLFGHMTSKTTVWVVFQK